MSLKALKKYFGRHSQGPRAGVNYLSEVIHPLRDPVLNESMAELFFQQCRYVKKQQSRRLAIEVNSSDNIALLIANMAHHCEMPVWHVSRDFYQQLERSDMARLFADAQRSKQILFFDQADELLNDQIILSSANETFESQALLKLANQRQGTTVFAVKDPQSLLSLGAQLDAVIALG